MQLAALSKVWVCGRSHAGTAGLNLARGMVVFASVVDCQVEVSASG
jgi:hypothetical protein